MRKTLMTTIATLLLVAGVGLVRSAEAAGSCSLQTIKGNHGGLVTGSISGVPLGVGGSPVLTFDGVGNFTGNDAAFGGIPGGSTDPALKNLADTLRAEGNHKILLDLLESAGQGFPLGFTPSDQYTILAPTDEAFAQLPAGVIEKLKGDPEKLRKFLLGHVIAGKAMIADMLVPAKDNAAKTQLEVTSMGGSEIRIQCDLHTGEHHPRINSNARIGKGDILFAGGVVHQIDQVLHVNPFQ